MKHIVITFNLIGFFVLFLYILETTFIVDLDKNTLYLTSVNVLETTFLPNFSNIKKYAIRFNIAPYCFHVFRFRTEKSFMMIENW